jgi:hypothetical protein
MTPCVENVVLRKKTSVHILCEGEALASLRHAYLGSFLDPEDIRELMHGGPSGTLLREQGSYSLVHNMGHRGPVIKAYVHRARTGSNLNIILFLFYSRIQFLEFAKYCGLT